ncbi:MAG: transcriptional activator TraM [Chromatiaceae bacterium]|nr:transcriptional activator TraM [Chromatiaceae bacterium]
MSKPNDSSGDDLIGDMIAEIARAQGMAICREDPIVAVVLLNQVVLRRYLEATVAPAAAAIREATRDALDQVEKVAKAQAHWLDQVSLKDRASFLEDQKALHEAWKADMQALIVGQNAALQQVVMQTVALLRTQAPAAGAVLATPPAPPTGQTSGPTGMGTPWAWIWAGMLLGTGATVVLTLAAVVGQAFAGQ